MFAVPLSGEKHVKLFRRALQEEIEGSRLLAPIASARSMSGFCAAVSIVLRALHDIQPENFGGHSESSAHVIIAVYSAVVRLLFCTRYCRSISGTRCQVLDTAHTRSISGLYTASAGGPLTIWEKGSLGW